MHEGSPSARSDQVPAGHDVAEIIGELVGGYSPGAAAAAAPADIRDPLPADVGFDDLAEAPETARHGLSALVREFEARLAEEVEAALGRQRDSLVAQHRARLARLREQAQLELRRRESTLRASLAAEQARQERRLRSYYARLIAAARNLARQREQLVETRNQLAHKLDAVSRLQQEVAQTRDVLSDQIERLDHHVLDDVGAPPFEA